MLFDLDGTLLDIDLGTFLGAYFKALGAATATHFGDADVLSAVLASTEAMQLPHPGRTNSEVFHEDFRARAGIDLDDPATYEVFDRFYAEEFPGLRHSAGPAEGGRDAVETALELGLGVAVATQPIFPRAAIEQRMVWAGLDDLGLSVVTTYEVMHACKPHGEYFRETAAMVGAEPSQCLMVGDDRFLDMPAADVGMRTYFTGPGDAPADWKGTMRELSDLLRRIAQEDDADTGVI